MNKICIIIPTIGKRREGLETSLKSALATDPTSVSKIIILDNTQDVSESSFIQKLSTNNSDNRLSIIKYPERLEMSDSWNKPLKEIEEDWILYLHDDDELIPKRFNNAVKGKLDQKFSFIAFDYLVRSQRKQNTVRRKTNLSETELICNIIKNPPKFVSTIINRNALLSINGFSRKHGFALDVVAFIRLIQKLEPAFYRDIIGFYTLDNNNASSTKNREKGYGDFIPYILSDIFDIYESPRIRATLLKFLYSFTYGSQLSLKEKVNHRIKKYLRYFFR